MSTKKSDAEVIEFPKPGKKTSSTEKIWGKAVYGHGYAGIPSILIQGQRRIGLNPMQMNICIQLLDYWFDPARKPFPTRKDLAQRIGCTEKTIQNNIRALEKAGLVKRQLLGLNLQAQHWMRISPSLRPRPLPEFSTRAFSSVGR